MSRSSRGRRRVGSASHWPAPGCPTASTSWPPAGHDPSPSRSCLPRRSFFFPPPRVVPFVDLRLGVAGDLQRLRVVLKLPMHGSHILEDGIGLREPLEG